MEIEVLGPVLMQERTGFDKFEIREAISIYQKVEG